jgi:hypothetical protein
MGRQIIGQDKETLITAEQFADVLPIVVVDFAVGERLVALDITMPPVRS